MVGAGRASLGGVVVRGKLEVIGSAFGGKEVVGIVVGCEVVSGVRVSMLAGLVATVNAHVVEIERGLGIVSSHWTWTGKPVALGAAMAVLWGYAGARRCGALVVAPAVRAPYVKSSKTIMAIVRWNIRL